MAEEVALSAWFFSFLSLCSVSACLVALFCLTRSVCQPVPAAYMSILAVQIPSPTRAYVLEAASQKLMFCTSSETSF